MLKLFLPNKKEHFADCAEVFCDLYSQVTGKKITVTFTDDGKSDLILFGSDADNRLAADRIIDGRMKSFDLRTGCDDYAIRSFEEKNRTLLFLASGNIRAAFYVIYDFFERAADCHYFWDGDVIPKKKALELKGWDVLERPRFEYRGLRYFAHRSLTRFQAEHWDFEDWKHEFDWIMKKRLNFAMLRIGIDDLFQKAFPDIVPYPDYRKTLPEAVDRSYDDRSLFWPLEYRGELRKKILAYGRSRGIFQPEDCGTMTHWYSRTPNAFLEKVKPTFIPQSSGNYTEKTGMVWDIRDDRNMENYFQLTRTHVKEYGSPEIFHTIGLAERMCFEDRDENLRMKLYAYRRIISKLREEYPHAPLLIGTWDFVAWWHHDEIKKLMNELDPQNTLIFDYISDVASESRCFRTWDIKKHFPWICGIFHAFESNNEIRGMYPEIEDRFPEAAADPMCKGLVFWPENSHQDTLMLDYFPTIAWDPEKYRIKEFIPTFCAKRYGTKLADRMSALWSDLLPFAELGRWDVEIDAENPIRNPYPENYFILGCMLWGRFFFLSSLLGDDTKGALRDLEYALYKRSKVRPMLADAEKLAEKLSAFDLQKQNDFLKRDLIDMARTLWARIMDLALCCYVLKLHDFRLAKATVKELSAYGKILRDLGRDLTLILGCSKEFSLYYALEDLKRKHTTNPNFEHTLKCNAENRYCRSFIYELSRFCYEKELDKLLVYVEKNAKAGIRGPLDEKKYRTIADQDIDLFYSTPLAKMRPDTEKHEEAFRKTLAGLASHIHELKKLEDRK